MNWIRLVDFGLVVLIWMVQLVVYPSFRYYAPEDLVRWHGPYTSGITVVVFPLMSAQLLLHGYVLYRDLSLVNIVLLLLVVTTWILTMVIFVPLHGKIGEEAELPETLAQLVNYNWWRTIIWSVIFLLGVGMTQK